MNFIHDIHSKMLDNNLILIYEGEFTQEITKSVLSMAERNLESTGEESSIKRKVFNVMVECLQNIVKHSEDKDVNDVIEDSAVFMIGKQDDAYSIISGNYIENSGVTPLKDMLEKVNGLDKDGLKQLYKDIIKSGKISEKDGAGIGFVDMARKSVNPLHYDFISVDEKSSFFCLKTKISRSK